MAPTATRRSKNCNRRLQVETDSSLESSTELPCSHICLSSGRSSSCSSSRGESSSRNSTTTASADKEDNGPAEVLQAFCSTPKGQRFRIPAAGILTCPPAPMKPRVAPKLLSRRSSTITYFAPPDIELFFLLAFHNVSA